MRLSRGLRGLITLLIMLLMLAAGGVLWLLGGTRSAVDWQQVHAVAFESDDWGLAGFVPTDAVLAGLDRDALTGGRFPQVYWRSTLEDSATVRRLADLMGSCQDRDGLPAVFQANYIMSALELVAEPQAGGREVTGSWRRYDLPALPLAYDRPGLWSAVRAAVREGVWEPAFHGSFHYDPQRRQDAVTRDPLARRAALQGVLVFPGSHRAWELGPWRPISVLAEELDRSLDIFLRLYGHPPRSVIAPDYVWDDRCEALWESRGLRVIQAKREQRHPERRGAGLGDRLAKVVDRAFSRLFHPDRIYLERNCRLEAVQAKDWRQVAETCYQDIHRAWARGEPAVIETHRVNFVHLDPEVAEKGFRALQHLLELLTQAADPALTFLTDDELAQLNRTGTSCVVRGGNLVVRNFSHAHRMITVPEAVSVETRLGSLPQLGTGRSALMLLAPLQTEVIALQPEVP